MKRSFSKRAWSAFLALAIIVTAVFGNVTTAKAETTALFESDVVYAAAGQEMTFDFTLNQAATVDVGLFVSNPSDVTLTLYDSVGNLVDWVDNPYKVYASEFLVYDASTYAYIDTMPNVEAGDYRYGITFSSDTYVMVIAQETSAEAKISDEKATITKGFTKKLYVSNGTVTKWSSSKKSVATVDKNGKVTAKKSGKATITATLSDGSKVKCAVTVKDNKYSATKITSSDVSYNEYGAKAYSASFDKNGNLVVKIMIVNGGYGKMTKIPGFRVTVKNQDGKTVGTYKKSSFSVSVPSYSSKSYSVTIKKSSKLSSKKTDLRNSTITVDGGTATVYY